MAKLPQDGALNLVPFIDIMLVLLCIVLSVSTFIARSSIEITLPKAKSTVVDNRVETVSIMLTKDNLFFVNDKEHSKDEITKLLKETGNDKHVAFYVDKDSTFEFFVYVIDELRMNHHDNFSIQTQK